MKTIGIDFGTTKTLVATWDPVRKLPTTLRIGMGKDDLPTTIHVDSQGQMVFGDNADNFADHDPVGYVRNIKRKLGRVGAIEVVHGQSYLAVDLVKQYLKYVLDRVKEEGVHDDIESVVITAPALAGESYREALQYAAKGAGIEQVSILDEPLAAGIGFLHYKQDTPLGDQAVVFDWGGGTLDLAVLQRRDGHLDLHPDLVGGDQCLGGEDIDDLLLAHMHVDDRPFAEQRRLRSAATDVKRQLAQKESVYFPKTMEINRDQFYKIIEEPMGQAMRAFVAFLERVRRSGLSINTVLLVGGTAQIPLVAARLKSQFGLTPVRWDRAIEAVALGAAIRAQNIFTTVSKQDSATKTVDIICPECRYSGRGTGDIMSAGANM